MAGDEMSPGELNPAKIAGALVLGLVGMAVVGLPQVSRATAEPEGDVARGKVMFEKRCTGCHSLDQGKEGPRLRDVYGRKAGMVAGFPYSDALRGAQIIWDGATLDKWLTDTASMLPKNDMDFRVPNAEERADIIAFLRASAQPAQKP
jgi:cytochrome c